MGLTLCVWHTNSNHIALPVSSVAGKDGRKCVCVLERVSSEGERMMTDEKHKEKDEYLNKIRKSDADGCMKWQTMEESVKITLCQFGFYP